MKKIALALAAAGLALSLSACGEVGTQKESDGSIRKFTVLVEGRPLECVSFNDSLNSQWGTCDWVKYHAQDSNGTP